MTSTSTSSLQPPRRLARTLLALSLAGAATLAHAGDNDRNRHDNHDRDRNSSQCKKDQDCAREALMKGEIRPLTAVLNAVRDKVPGDVIEVELDRDDGIWIYEVKVLPPNGRRKKLKIDARTLDILKID